LGWVAVLVVRPFPAVDACAGWEIIEHFGTCDASAAAAAGTDRMVVASDEDNILRVYPTHTAGMPLYTLDLTPFLEAWGKHPEADIEGAASVGNRVYWITSHGTNKKGHLRPNRHRLFATETAVDDGRVAIRPVGRPYTELIRDLGTTMQLGRFKLGEAAKQPPRACGGLNIEGLCATPEGGLWIAFRNPIPDGMALLIPLENPDEVIVGKTARFGNAIRLPLGGLGVRSIAYVETRGTYLIVAGPADPEAIFRLYEWSGNPSVPPKPRDGIPFKGLQPEGLVVFPSAEPRVLVVSDDGTMEIEGRRCKDAPLSERRFRTFRLPYFPSHPSGLNEPPGLRSLDAMTPAQDRMDDQSR